MQVVRDLRRGPHREHAVAVVRGDAAVRLDRRVRRALEEVPVVADQIGGGEAGVDVAERELDLLGDVRAPRLVVDLDVLALERVLDGEDRLERLVLDVDQRERLVRGVLVERRDGGDRLADVAHLVDRERVLVLRPRDDAVSSRACPRR